jgi:hypothetical protein
MKQRLCVLQCCAVVLMILLLNVHCAVEVNVLFVGNSYVNNNNLPEILNQVLVEALPKSNEISVRSYAPNGQTFLEHVQDVDGTRGNTELSQWLRTDPEPWDWVILQEQSQTPGFQGFSSEFTDSTDSAIRLDNYIEATGGETVFLMTWGRREGDERLPSFYPDFTTMQNLLTAGYDTYMDITSTAKRPTRVAPVGIAFQIVHDRILRDGGDPLASGSDFSRLYRNDGSHPSVEGSYLAACVLYATLTNRDPRQLKYAPDAVSQQRRMEIQEVAFDAIRIRGDTIVSNAAPPEANPTSSPTSDPTRKPTPSPTQVFVPPPTPRPTFAISAQPISVPSSSPTTAEPSEFPTGEPTVSLPSSDSPTVFPSDIPSLVPSIDPSPTPTVTPSTAPSISRAPSQSPTLNPSAMPSVSFSPSVSNFPSSASPSTDEGSFGNSSAGTRGLKASSTQLTLVYGLLPHLMVFFFLYF